MSLFPHGVIKSSSPPPSPICSFFSYMIRPQGRMRNTQLINYVSFLPMYMLSMSQSSLRIFFSVFLFFIILWRTRFHRWINKWIVFFFNCKIIWNHMNIIVDLKLLENYGVPFRKKLVTFRTPSLIFVRHQSIFRAKQNFNQINIYLYATGTIFCKHVFLFCAALNIFSQHESSFGCHIFFLLPQDNFVAQC